MIDMNYRRLRFSRRNREIKTDRIVAPSRGSGELHVSVFQQERRHGPIPEYGAFKLCVRLLDAHRKELNRPCVKKRKQIARNQAAKRGWQPKRQATFQLGQPICICASHDLPIEPLGFPIFRKITFPFPATWRWHFFRLQGFSLGGVHGRDERDDEANFSSWSWGSKISIELT